jgi:hypothetical protein
MYRHPFSQKNEIGKIVYGFLVVGVTPPSTNPYSWLVVMVLKKQGAWWIYPSFQDLNKIIVKDKLSILVIDDLWMTSMVLNSLPKLISIQSITKFTWRLIFSKQPFAIMKSITSYWWFPLSFSMHLLPSKVSWTSYLTFLSKVSWTSYLTFLCHFVLIFLWYPNLKWNFTCPCHPCGSGLTTTIQSSTLSQ